MAIFDEILRRVRIEKAKEYIKRNDALLDIGCYTGYFLSKIKDKIKEGYGIDELTKNRKEENLTFKKIKLNRKLPFKSKKFTAITMIAVLEHLKNKKSIAKEIARVLKIKGRVIITVPSPKADKLLNFLAKIKIIEEEDFLKQHITPTHEEVLDLFLKNGFKLKVYETFELGYNNLYVFERIK